MPTRPRPGVHHNPNPAQPALGLDHPTVGGSRRGRRSMRNGLQEVLPGHGGADDPLIHERELPDDPGKLIGIGVFRRQSRRIGLGVLAVPAELGPVHPRPWSRPQTACGSPLQAECESGIAGLRTDRRRPSWTTVVECQRRPTIPVRRKAGQRRKSRALPPVETNPGRSVAFSWLDRSTDSSLTVMTWTPSRSSSPASPVRRRRADWLCPPPHIRGGSVATHRVARSPLRVRVVVAGAAGNRWWPDSDVGE